MWQRRGGAGVRCRACSGLNPTHQCVEGTMAGLNILGFPLSDILDRRIVKVIRGLYYTHKVKAPRTFLARREAW